jgi:putative MATE family efflux protein
MMIANTLELAVGLIEFWLVRPFGPAATAAIGVSRQVTFLLEAMAVVITAGVITLVSQGVGACVRPAPAGQDKGGDPAKSTIPIFPPGEVVRQSFALVLLLGIPTALAGYWLSGPLLSCLQASDETRAFGEPYLQVYFLGIIFMWANLVGTALFRAAGDVWTPLKLGLGVSLFQVVLDYFFIYGAGPVPAFEVQGAALGAVSARACGLLIYLLLLLKGTGHLCLRWSSLRGFDWELSRHILRIGVPMALANVLRHGSRVVFLAIAGASALGMSLQAAVGVALQVRLIGILVALAFQTATATLVGQAIGRNDMAQAKLVGLRAVQFLALLMGIIAAILIALANPLAGLFIERPEVAGLGARVLCWFAVAQFFSSLSIGTQGALMGAGDTLPAMRYTLVSEWCLMLPLSYLLVVLDLAPDGLLAVWVLAPALTLTLMQRRFRSGRWQTH